jgi:hypothetical protein
MHRLLGVDRFNKVFGHSKELVDGRWGKEDDDIPSKFHATSKSVCHSTSPNLTPQDDVSYHVNIQISCHIINYHISQWKWSMTSG